MIFVESGAGANLDRIIISQFFEQKKEISMKSKKRGLIIIILASFAILADIALFILEKSGYMVGHEQPPLYYIGGVAIGVILLLMGIQTYRKGS